MALKLVCPRCSGHVSCDQAGEVSCVNCGWVQPPPDPLPLVPSRFDRNGVSRL